LLRNRELKTYGFRELTARDFPRRHYRKIYKIIPQRKTKFCNSLSVSENSRQQSCQFTQAFGLQFIITRLVIVAQTVVG
jgi:hypothetical protein